MELKIGDQKITINEKLIQENPEKVQKQIEEYLNSQRTSFELTVDYPDNFTGKVMREMSRIPYGETRTYSDIAQKLDTAPIAVGQACGRNPVPVIIPCHRVKGKNSLGGYRYGESVKKKLLDLEAAYLDN